MVSESISHDKITRNLASEKTKNELAMAMFDQRKFWAYYEGKQALCSDIEKQHWIWYVAI